MKTVKTKKKSFLTAMAIGCAAVAAVILATAKTANSNVPIKVGTYNIRLVYGDKGSANEWDKRKSDLVSLVKKNSTLMFLECRRCALSRLHISATN